MAQRRRSPAANAEPLLRDFAERFRVARRKDLEQAESWLSAGLLGEIARLGHQIKGTGPTFGFPSAGRSGARLEAAARAGDSGRVAAELAALRRLLAEGARSRRAVRPAVEPAREPRTPNLEPCR